MPLMHGVRYRAMLWTGREWAWGVTSAAFLLVVAFAAGLTGTAMMADADVFPGLSVGDGKTIYTIGDSWAAGLYADPNHALVQDAADDMGMTTMVDAQSGSGYLNAPFGTQTYVQRATQIPAGINPALVLIQGGSNDVGQSTTALKQAVTETIQELHQRLPHTRIVLLGPGPDPWPVDSSQKAVDDVLAQVAKAQHLSYISPLEEGWFTSSDVDDIIDTTTSHPTSAGDEILGNYLAKDLRKILNPTAMSHKVGK